MQLKAVYTTDNAADADVLRVILEQANIRCEVVDEGQGGLAGVSVGKVKVLVREEDHVAARKIVADYEKS